MFSTDERSELTFSRGNTKSGSNDEAAAAVFIQSLLHAFFQFFFHSLLYVTRFVIHIPKIVEIRCRKRTWNAKGWEQQKKNHQHVQWEKHTQNIQNKIKERNEMVLFNICRHTVCLRIAKFQSKLNSSVFVSYVSFSADIATINNSYGHCCARSSVGMSATFFFSLSAKHVFTKMIRSSLIKRFYSFWIRVLI